MRRVAGPGPRGTYRKGEEDCAGGEIGYNQLNQHRISHLPSVSLREVGGQQDLAPKELEAMCRKAVLEEKFVRISCSLKDLWVKS